ncbi:MAG: 2-amino-4-hydroxy-6-hydroxymethyldihydropteridine diphosphokinase [Candidatus Tenebribacter mawsonii]|nr:2-amino-4-hydroxy-6-hydroxymethyldihydropteridine diphosphokinase [Candidatus Tenebribacter mawsonii]
MNCYLGLGSNLGDKKKHITKAITQISLLENVEVLRTSTFITTAPYGKTDQPYFLNCVIELNTNLEPEILLKKCLEIEDQLGRIRKEKWGPRTIDIDMLIYGNKVINSEILILPHPELHKREFVLTSLNELCPNLFHPILKKKITELFMEIK